MANAIGMIRRCAKFGAPGEYHEYVIEEVVVNTGPAIPEEPMGHGDHSTDAQVST